MSDVVSCVVCNHAGRLDEAVVWHPFRHQIQTALGFGIQVSDQDAKTDVRQARMPFDPVLRQALIDKEIITVDDLRTAEAKIEAVSGLFNQEVIRGTDDREGEQDSGS